MTVSEPQESAKSKSAGGSIEEGPGWLPFLIVSLTAIILFTLRLTAPPNLLDQDQERPASYVLDVVKNGNWLCQRDLNGEITSKPPLYTWLAALVAMARGQVDEFA